jgi:methylglyoxal synthase
MLVIGHSFTVVHNPWSKLASTHDVPGVLGRVSAPSGRKRIVLIAHDNRKADLLEWARFNRGTLSQHELHATGTTGALLSDELGLEVKRFLSGPLGGDQQVGAAIAEGRVDVVIFFWDALEPHPHDVDVKALLRIAVVYNVPIACNRSTADFVMSSPLMAEPYRRGASAGGAATKAATA